MSSAIVAGGPSGRLLPHDGLAVRAVDVVKHYEDGLVEALKGVSLEVARGEYLAIMGPSGSGKSTLLHLLGALDRPTRGTVEILGHDLLRTRDLADLRARKLGFVFQLHHLIPNLTLAENVALPMHACGTTRRERRRRAVELLERVGLAHRIEFFPVKVSGGERQRAAIARALVNDPELLLADEPTGSVDSKTGEGILDIFRELNRDRGVTVIVITHNDRIGEGAPRCVRIVDGRIAGETRREASAQNAERAIRNPISSEQ